jgi:hypothetical protein
LLKLRDQSAGPNNLSLMRFQAFPAHLNSEAGRIKTPSKSVVQSDLANIDALARPAMFHCPDWLRFYELTEMFSLIFLSCEVICLRGPAGDRSERFKLFLRREDNRREGTHPDGRQTGLADLRFIRSHSQRVGLGTTSGRIPRRHLDVPGFRQRGRTARWLATD